MNRNTSLIFPGDRRRPRLVACAKQPDTWAFFRDAAFQPASGPRSGIKDLARNPDSRPRAAGGRWLSARR